MTQTHGPCTPSAIQRSPAVFTPPLPPVPMQVHFAWVAAQPARLDAGLQARQEQLAFACRREPVLGQQ